MTQPEWLPDVVEVSGDWDDTLLQLYSIFVRDFKMSTPLFQGMPVWHDRRRPDRLYEEGFWHLITTEDAYSGDRLPDFSRAKRLPWCAATIQNSEDDAVRVCDAENRDGILRTYLWLEEQDYGIVLEKRDHDVGQIAFLITAYYLDWPRSRENWARMFRENET